MTGANVSKINEIQIRDTKLTQATIIINNTFPSMFNSNVNTAKHFVFTNKI